MAVQAVLFDIGGVVIHADLESYAQRGAKVFNRSVRTIPPTRDQTRRFGIAEIRDETQAETNGARLRFRPEAQAAPGSRPPRGQGRCSAAKSADPIEALGRSGATGWLAEIPQARVWYEPHLERAYEDFEMRRAESTSARRHCGRVSFAPVISSRTDTRSSGRDLGTNGRTLLDEDYLILAIIALHGYASGGRVLTRTTTGCIAIDRSGKEAR